MHERTLKQLQEGVKFIGHNKLPDRKKIVIPKRSVFTCPHCGEKFEIDTDGDYLYH